MDEIDLEKRMGLLLFGGEQLPEGERRRHERYQESLEIRVTWPGKETLVGVTRDFSDGGTYIRVQFEPQPAAETEMLLQLNAPVNEQAAPFLKARVVRSDVEGIAFRFMRDG
jgi:hypothetical protein